MSCKIFHVDGLDWKSAFEILSLIDYHLMIVIAEYKFLISLKTDKS